MNIIIYGNQYLISKNSQSDYIFLVIKYLL